VERLIGVDINVNYLAEASKRLETVSTIQVELQQGNFFKLDWFKVLGDYKKYGLILGNPPWVTSAELGALESENLPEKSNFHGRAGIEAMMGKSNFDISEWMLLRYLEWLQGRNGALAVLCKTAVARKILSCAWNNKYPIQTARLYKIDAMKYFGAAVDACLFVLETAPSATSQDCDVFESLDALTPMNQIGFHDKLLILSVKAYERRRYLFGPEQNYIWRSGIKHDCTKVMELKIVGETLQNGFGETVDIEDTLLFPLFKSSDISNGRLNPRGFMLVTQQTVREDTTRIRMKAPKTWAYLEAYASWLQKRSSSIYRNRPAFSIFGVGDYSFTSWKVAISGFYKKINFTKIGPIDQRPAVFDDTVYFLSCRKRRRSRFYFLTSQFRSSARVLQLNDFLADKRPITIDLLKRLSIKSWRFT
jgi:hypothetical protein